MNVFLVLKFFYNMKRLLLLTIFSGISFISFAQFPTITATNQIPAIDDSIHYINANNFGFDPDGSGGAIDVVWNFSALIDAGTAIDFWYEDPTATMEAANFTTASVAMANSLSANGYEYFSTSASTISRMGYTDPVASSIYYDQAWNRYEFPITPGINWSATYTGSMTSLGAGEDSVTIAGGNYQATPDQFGSMTLPASIFGGQPEYFDSVVRVHVIESFQIKAWIVGTAALTINVNDDYYFYFDEETQEPLLIYGVTTDDAGGSPQTVLRYQNIVGTGTPPVSIIEKESNIFEVYPNPSNGIFNIVSNNNLENTNIEVIDITGKIVYTKNVNQLTTQTLDLTELSVGVYTLKVSNIQSNQTKRVIINRD
jgi:hypothetical protein